MNAIILALFFLIPGLEPSTERPYTVSEVQKAIRSLAPQISRTQVRYYARLIHKVTYRKRIDPLLLVAFVTSESQWKPNLRSSTNDYGLGQIHVAANGSAKFLGREKELFHPRTNLREWSRLADMWRNYHNTKEDPAEAKQHVWWKHMKWGYKVKDPRPTRIDMLYQQLKQMFTIRHSEV